MYQFNQTIRVAIVSTKTYDKIVCRFLLRFLKKVISSEKRINCSITDTKTKFKCPSKGNRKGIITGCSNAIFIK